MSVINIPCNINISAVLYSTLSLMQHIFIMVWQIPLGLLTCGCVGCACAPLLVCVLYWLCRFCFVVVCTWPCFLHAVVEGVVVMGLLLRDQHNLAVKVLNEHGLPAVHMHTYRAKYTSVALLHLQVGNWQLMRSHLYMYFGCVAEREQWVWFLG